MKGEHDVVHQFLGIAAVGEHVDDLVGVILGVMAVIIIRHQTLIDWPKRVSVLPTPIRLALSVPRHVPP